MPVQFDEPAIVLRCRSVAPAARPEPEPGPVVCLLDPLERSDWDEQVARFPSATVFHTRAWLEVLRETYGHRPVGLCFQQEDRWQACLPLAEVRSYLTGRRGVSLPFTDFCPLLVAEEALIRPLWQEALQLARRQNWSRVEVRDSIPDSVGVEPSLEYYLHELDLQGGPEALLRRMDPAFRRSLRKAESSGLRPEISTELGALAAYYELHCLTRQRHGLPPQPWRFFQNIGRHLLAQDLGMVVLVRKDGRVVAGAVFLHFGKGAVYKFGASDMSAQQFRPNNLAMWTAVRYYCGRDFGRLHLGRTSLANEGLRRFKISLGARETRLAVACGDPRSGRCLSRQDRTEGWHTRLFRRLPVPVLRWVGQWLYPHMD